MNTSAKTTKQTPRIIAAISLGFVTGLIGFVWLGDGGGVMGLILGECIGYTMIAPFQSIE
jgi:hypothetical protein